MDEKNNNQIEKKGENIDLINKKYINELIEEDENKNNEKKFIGNKRDKRKNRKEKKDN